MGDLGAREQVHDHGRDGTEIRHLVFLDALGGKIAVPAREENHGGPGVEGAVHAALHARHMKEGEHGQLHIVGFGAEPGFARTQR